MYNVIVMCEVLMHVINVHEMLVIHCVNSSEDCPPVNVQNTFSLQVLQLYLQLMRMVQGFAWHPKL